MTVKKYKHPLYSMYRNMIYRCYSNKCPYYYRYGGRGIIVCDRWLNDFWAFVADMGDKPNPHLTLDRINTDGNYEAANCRWATWTEQANNRQNTPHFIKLREHEIETLPRDEYTYSDFETQEYLRENYILTDGTIKIHL